MSVKWMNGTRAHKAWKFINNKEYILSLFEVMRHVCKYVSSRMYDWGIALWYDIENLCNTKESERKGVNQVRKSECQ
jgi:hypothetical protein